MTQLIQALVVLMAISVGLFPQTTAAQRAAKTPTKGPPAPLLSAPASADDSARFLAGLAPDAASALAGVTRELSWQTHGRTFGRDWEGLESRQMRKVREFSNRNLTSSQKTLFYMFSGPDYLFADALFPKARTIVLSGLEPVGPIPDLASLKINRLGPTLVHLRTSLAQLMGKSYFITLDMDKHLRRGDLPGVLPVLYVFLARTGKTIRDVSHMRLEPDGRLEPIVADPRAAPADRPRVARIDVTGKDGTAQTIYYFSTNLADKGVAASGFLRFCEALGKGDSLVKSASYLLHGAEFSSVRSFLLANSTTILQDDTGVPVTYLGSDQWELVPYGRYVKPIPVFARYYQKRLKEVFDRGPPPPVDFSFGYRWKPGQSGLLLARRR